MDSTTANIKAELPQTLTILLLGETGVGKSTWINGFANFLAYETLEEAQRGPTICTIPTSFNMTDDDYQERIISVGSDSNEVSVIGHSATQHPQSYIFPMGGNMIRLIDTPGIGDVRGTRQDKKNLERILCHIAHLENLHAICILLKPNTSKLTLMFSFCIRELLTHLHKDACQNIVFCFTHSRSTFYRPGDTLPALEALLLENPDIQIPLTRSTLYCMDNESIRFLYALKEGVEFSSEECENYSVSWQKSVAEVGRLLAHASKSIPHKVQSTMSLNNARRRILALRVPLAEISRNIQHNIVMSENQNKLIQDCQSSSNSSDLKIKHVQMTRRYFLEPRTVCTSVKCTRRSENGIIYKSHCHENCTRGKLKTDRVLWIPGHKTLKKCSAFDILTGNCRMCKCNWTKHMKIDSETILTPVEISVDENKTELEKRQLIQKAHEEHLEQFRSTEAEIIASCVVFTCFLRQNAITHYEDAMVGHMAMLIGQEHDLKIRDAMSQMLQNYQNQLEISEFRHKLVSLPVLENCVQSLCNLSSFGNVIKQMMDESLNYSNKSNFLEKKVNIGTSSPSIGNLMQHLTNIFKFRKVAIDRAEEEIEKIQIESTTQKIKLDSNPITDEIDNTSISKANSDIEIKEQDLAVDVAKKEESDVQTNNVNEFNTPVSVNESTSMTNLKPTRGNGRRKKMRAPQPPTVPPLPESELSP